MATAMATVASPPPTTTTTTTTTTTRADDREALGVASYSISLGTNLLDKAVVAVAILLFRVSTIFLEIEESSTKTIWARVKIRMKY